MIKAKGGCAAPEVPLLPPDAERSSQNVKTLTQRRPDIHLHIGLKESQETHLFQLKDMIEQTLFLGPL